MFYPLSLFISLRYIANSKEGKGVSFSMIASIGAIVLGVCATIVVLSVMNGIQLNTGAKALQNIAQAVVIFNKDQNKLQIEEAISKQQFWQHAITYRAEQSIVLHNGNIYESEIMGIDNSEINNSLVLKISPTKIFKVQHNNIIISSALARMLNAKQDDNLVIYVLENKNSQSYPITVNVQVVDVFTSREMQILIDLKTLEKYKPTEFSALRLTGEDVMKVPEYAKVLQADLGQNVKIKDWSEQKGSLFIAMKMEKILISILLFFIISIAVFNIMSLIMMNIKQKQKDIAILMTNGATESSIVSIFLCQGLIIGILGSILGSILGILISLNIDNIFIGLSNIEPIREYFVDDIPVNFLWMDVLVVFIFVFISVLVASIYPAKIASKIVPSESLKANL